MRELERQRAELWQQAAHDLRGNLGVVSNVAQGLDLRATCRPRSAASSSWALLLQQRQSVAPSARRRHRRWRDCRPAKKGAASRRSTRPGCCAAWADYIRPLADDRGLYLKVTGGATVARRRGRRGEADASPRTCCSTRSSTPSAAASTLSRASAEALRRRPGGSRRGHRAGPSRRPGRADRGRGERGDGQARDGADAPPASPPAGDGRRRRLGLAIVKRLCDLLDATVELETGAGRGNDGPRARADALRAARALAGWHGPRAVRRRSRRPGAYSISTPSKAIAIVSISTPASIASSGEYGEAHRPGVAEAPGHDDALAGRRRAGAR